ncbi:copper homeostasis protein CutC [Shinella sp. PSBB067]|uniref:copper homeostasis protein CutC n=1 Tax=Shinella sp. PSBB067 TaxID=2715959 RepID=UPI00193BE22A|nr:copper homeostasis protein CutC [Shinella sp. PSBB067]QRI65450.1 copper homeostasis protein CutC [Shinella sp. PSBB067]
MTKPLIELCVEGIDGFLAAQEAGADRVELCASLMEGGLTPSLATIRAAVKAARIPVHVIIRPRGGDFLYSQAEFETMVEDIRALRGEGVSGVVIGCLTPDGRIDQERTRALVEAARPMSVTCHRAFDMTADAGEALEALVRCGVDRVLTSGQRDTAVEGIAILKSAVEQAAGRIVIMGCGVLDAENIREVRDAAGLAEMHFAALRTVQSGMVFRNPHVGMGGTEKDREYELTLTDGDAVRATIAAAKS